MQNKAVVRPVLRKPRSVILRYLISSAVASILFFGICYAGSDPVADAKIAELNKIVDLDIDGWMFKWGDFPGPEQKEYDVTGWKLVKFGYRWFPSASKGWYRRWVVVPEKIGGLPVTGSKLWMPLHFRDDGTVYVDGKLVDKEWKDDGWTAALTESAKPGDRLSVAIHLINNALDGGLENVQLHSDRSEPVVVAIKEYLAGRREAQELVLNRRGRATRDSLLLVSLGLVDLTKLKSGDGAGFIASLKSGVEKMTEILVILRAEAQPKFAEAKRLQAELDGLLDKARAKGIDVSYPMVTRTVIHNFIGWAKKDLTASEAPTVARGIGIADYLIGSGQRAIKETRELLANGKNKPLPKLTPGPVQIKNGAFYQGDTPVFLNGFGHFGQVRKDTPLFNDYGFNMIQIVMDMSCVQPKGLAKDRVKKLLKNLDDAAKHGVVIDLLIGDAYPKWALKKYPGLVRGKDGPLNFNIEHPAARLIMKRFVDELLPQIADHPGLFSLCLTNEPGYTNNGPISEREFHRWLQNKHGSIKKLNNVYGSKYASFKKVPLPTRKGSFEGDPPRPIWYDWCKYNQDRVTKHLYGVRDMVKAVAPNLRMHVKIQGRVFDGQYPFPHGINPEAITRLGRIIGGDNWSYSRSGLHREYAQGWRRQAMFYDFQRSISPHAPIFNSENHPIEDANAKWVSGDHMRTMLWQGVMHGMSASTTWLWEHSTGRRSMITQSILTRPNAVEASGRTALDMLRLGKEAVALQQAKGEVALLFSASSILGSETFLDEIKSAYVGLYFQDTPIKYVTDRMAGEGALADYRLLIAPNNKFIPDATTKAVTQYVQNGGTLVVAGDAFTHDEYGKKRDRETTALLANTLTKSDTTWKVGKGTVIYTPPLMKPREYAALLDGIIDDAGIDRDIRVTDIHQRRPWGVRTQSVKYDGGHLVYVVNLSSRAQTVKLVGEKPLGLMTDLLTGEQYGPMLELKPLVPLMLRVK
jgi:hypothetical protein